MEKKYREEIKQKNKSLRRWTLQCHEISCSEAPQVLYRLAPRIKRGFMILGKLKTKDSAGVRDFYYNDDEKITVESFKLKARKLFFLEGVSKDHPHCSWEYLWDVSKQRSQRNFKVWRWRLVHLWKTHQEVKKPLYAPVIEWGEGTLCTIDNLGDHHLLITYKSVTESSFSEVFLTMVLFSREQCWDTSLLSQLLTRETPLQEYGHWKMGFPLWGSTKGLSAFSTRPTMILLSHHLMTHQISDMSSLSQVRIRSI